MPDIVVQAPSKRNPNRFRCLLPDPRWWRQPVQISHLRSEIPRFPNYWNSYLSAVHTRVYLVDGPTRLSGHGVGSPGIVRLTPRLLRQRHSALAPYG
jgi:hypothetical protein